MLHSGKRRVEPKTETDADVEARFSIEPRIIHPDRDLINFKIDSNRRSFGPDTDTDADADADADAVAEADKSFNLEN